MCFQFSGYRADILVFELDGHSLAKHLCSAASARSAATLMAHKAADVS